MLMSIRYMIISLVAAILLIGPALAQDIGCGGCKNCVTDACEMGAGYMGSTYPRCFSCNPVIPHREIPFSSKLMPGFLTEQAHGKIVVKRVIDSSLAGMVLPGDEIVSINGQLLGMNPCALKVWNGKGRQSAEITLRREGMLKSVNVSIRPISAYLGDRWFKAAKSQLINASYSPDREGTQEVLLPYIFGLRVRPEESHYVVVDVLQDAPAGIAGIMPGDSVRIVDSGAVLSAPIDLETGTWTRATVILAWQSSGGKERRVTLESESLTDVLSASRTQSSELVSSRSLTK